jgi:hypothetical protein
MKREILLHVPAYVLDAPPGSATRETETPPSAETPYIAPRCTDQGPGDQGPIDPSRQSEHPCCDIMIAWLVPLPPHTVTAQRSPPRFSDGVDVPS